MRRSPKILDATDGAKVRDLVRSGATIAAVARRFDVSATQIRSIISREKFGFVPGDPLPSEEEWRTWDAALCFECGRWFKQVGRHLQSHGMTSDEYRARWGLHSRQPLSCRSVSERRSRIAIRTGGMERLRDMPGSGGGFQERKVGKTLSSAERVHAYNVHVRELRDKEEDERARARGFESMAAWIIHLRDEDLPRRLISKEIGEPVDEVDRIIRRNKIPWRGPGPIRTKSH